jgi:hypothetical protein
MSEVVKKAKQNRSAAEWSRDDGFDPVGNTASKGLSDDFQVGGACSLYPPRHRAVKC